MRFRTVLLYPWALIFLLIPTVFAQKQVVATVNPNTAALSSTADIYDPRTGIIAPVAGKINVARKQHVAVRLGNGQVLLAGGYDNYFLEAAELFNPATGSFTATGDMTTPRVGAAASILQGGTVLIAGGYNGSYLNLAETYDPDSGTFIFAATMNTARGNPVATLLSNGKVLITGGFNSGAGSGAFLSSAEIYDPSKKTFTASSSAMSYPRRGHTATLLLNGTVLVTGGCTNSDTNAVYCDQRLSSADIYDPSTDKFTATGAMTHARMDHTATLLPNGNVLITGGTDGTSNLSTAEIYNPQTGTFTATGPMTIGRTQHTANVLPNGKVLIAGGYSSQNQYLSSAETFDPQAGTFTAVSSSMSTPRFQHTATALSDGRILLAGGQDSDFLVFNYNFDVSTNDVSTNIVFSPDSKTGFVSYTGSGVVLAFSADTGAVLQRIVTGGQPTWITPLPDGITLAVVSALDSKIFMINMNTLSLRSTYSFTGSFGFGSSVTLSPDGSIGYVSSSGTGEVIKFSTSTGQQLGRLGNMTAPAQITITKDGNTLIVVDTSAEELVFVDAPSMSSKYTMSPLTTYPTTSFTISSNVVLTQDESTGVIASNDGYFFIFVPSTGAIVNVVPIGSQPASTTLTASGLFWLVLGQGSFSILPTWNPSAVQIVSVPGNALTSANIVVSPDIRYAFYTSATLDQVYQLDIGSGAVVGSFLVGDNPNISQDQASSVAFTPNYGKLAVLNFLSNTVNLLTDTFVLNQPRFVSQQNQFTGLSLVNLSSVPANLSLTAIGDDGTQITTSNTTTIVNPVSMQLPANGQQTMDVAQLFSFDTTVANSGRIIIMSDQPGVVGFSDTGQIHSSFLGAYLSNMEGIPLYPGYGSELYNYIIPEVPQSTTVPAELSFVNPNYNSITYDLIHYGTNGTAIETKNGNTATASTRNAKSVSDVITTTTSNKVLFAGGFNLTSTKASAEFEASAEFYDLVANSFSTTAGMSTPRQGHTATALPTGEVLVTGGENASVVLNTAALYDPFLASFTNTGATMNVERYRHTATFLANGLVLLAGGQNSKSINNTAELYNPAAIGSVPGAGGFAYTTTPMTTPRDAHTATLLSNGQVLLAGGLDGIGTSATAEIYDPVSSTFKLTGTMTASRAFHTAVLLLNGKVLIAGGYNGSYLNSAEIYDPATGSFSATSPMVTARSEHTATLLDDGTVLITGGLNSGGSLNTAELYDPNSGTFSPVTGYMISPRSLHTATLVELACTSTAVSPACPTTTTTQANGSTTTTLTSTTVTVPKVLVAGGTDGANTLDTAEYYDPSTRQFTQTSGDMNTARQGHTATLLPGSDQGYLSVTSTTQSNGSTSTIGMQFTEIYNNGGANTALNGIDINKYAGVTTVYSPQFAILPNCVTLLNVINANPDYAANVTITLHAPNGTVLASPMSWALPINAQIKGNLFDLFKDDPRLANQTGWVEVTSDQDKIVGTISFTNSSNAFLASVVLSGTPSTNFLFPLVSQDSDYGTGIGLLNPGSSPANVTLELWNPSGRIDYSTSVVVPARGQLAKGLTDFFKGMQPYQYANVRIRSNQPLYSFGSLYALDLHFMSALTAVPYPGQ
jgi:deoxycytidylate deaminase